MNLWQRIRLALTPHATGHTDVTWGRIGACDIDGCAPNCPKLLRRLRYVIPRARAVKVSWRVDVTPPRAEDVVGRALAAFARLNAGGEAACVICSRVGHCPHRCQELYHCVECDPPPTHRIEAGRPVPIGACCHECVAFGPCNSCAESLASYERRLAEHRATPRHFDSAEKSCYEYGCADDCPVGGSQRPVGGRR